MIAGASGGSRHWRNQRFTSVALLPLAGWFIATLCTLPDLSHATMMRWLAQPLQALLAALFGATALWHSAQGWRVVLEDYVGGRLLAPSLLASRLLHLGAAVVLLAALALIAAGRA